MRERRPEDWRRDLRDRHPLERRVETEIGRAPNLTLLHSSTSSMDRLDFQVLCPGERICELELKAKRQPYRGWTRFRPDVAEADLFMVDEITLRKLIDAGRYGVLLVRDEPQGRWVVWTSMELSFASKVRVSRRLATESNREKGKVLLNMCDTPHHVDRLELALATVASLMESIDQNWTAIEPWPNLGTVPLIGEAS